jgi:predicted dehydrogenase
MVEASVSHRAFLMEAMWTRFMPLMQQTIDLIGEGKIGTLKYIRADFGFLSSFNPEGRLYNLRLGGGSLLDIGIYPLFLCLQLLGEPDEIRAPDTWPRQDRTRPVMPFLPGATASRPSSAAPWPVRPPLPPRSQARKA